MKYSLCMRLFQRENGVWYIELKRGKKKSLRTKNKQEAERLFRKIKREYLAGKLIQLEKTTSLKDFLKEYIDWAANTLSESSLRNIKRSFKLFLQIIGDKPLSHYRKKDLDDYKTERSKIVKPASVNIEVRTIKAAFSKAVEWEIIKKNPFAGVKEIKCQQRPLKYLDEQQIRKVLEILEEFPPVWKHIFLIALNTGGRLSEITNLTWQDIRDGFVVFRNTKNRKVRNVPISKELNNILEEMKLKRKGPSAKLFPFTDKLYISKKFKKIFRKAGLSEDYSFHCLRHTFASRLAMKGVDLVTIKQLLGHSDIRTTMIYQHLTTEHLKRAVDMLGEFEQPILRVLTSSHG